MEEARGRHALAERKKQRRPWRASGGTMVAGAGKFKLDERAFGAHQRHKRLEVQADAAAGLTIPLVGEVEDLHFVRSAGAQEREAPERNQQGLARPAFHRRGLQRKGSLWSIRLQRILATAQVTPPCSPDGRGSQPFGAWPGWEVASALMFAASGCWSCTVAVCELPQLLSDETRKQLWFRPIPSACAQKQGP